jgi:hypothetical protein
MRVMERLPPGRIRMLHRATDAGVTGAAITAIERVLAPAAVDRRLQTAA